MGDRRLQVGLSLTIPGLEAGDVVDAAVRADGVGVDRLTFGEATYDPAALAAAVARRVATPLAAG